jgi:thiol-disulfide isomerase/thioredoxin
MVILGCRDRGPVKRSWGKMKGLENIVGNMNDISYSSGRTQEPRPNALNEPVSMTDFEGNFVWSEYAATWCPVCAQQTPETRKVEKELGEEIVFLTVMTGKSNAYNCAILVPDRVQAEALRERTAHDPRGRQRDHARYDGEGLARGRGGIRGEASGIRGREDQDARGASAT